MSEKIYNWLLHFLAPRFTQRYGRDAVQLFRDRARDESGLRAQVRLWADLLFDFAGLAWRERLSVRPVWRRAGGSSFAFGQLQDKGHPHAAALLAGVLVSTVTLISFPFLLNPSAHLHAVSDPEVSGFAKTETGRFAHPVSAGKIPSRSALFAGPHHAKDFPKAEFVIVEKDVKLEVLDWGGSGRPVVLLAGLGGTAHGFDDFAARLATKYHVYGITRRGFGNSSVAAPTLDNYRADRLGDDVLAVCRALHLQRPVLAGHSIAGEELSSIGSRHPEAAAGLIYLDAAYSYAYYDRVHGDFTLDLLDMEGKLASLDYRSAASDIRPVVSDLQKRLLPLFQRDLQGMQQDFEFLPPPPPPASGARPARERVPALILAGERKYDSIHAPVLAIFACPHELPQTPGAAAQSPEKIRSWEAWDRQRVNNQIEALKAGVPSARILPIPHASHMIFRSNEAEVLREMNAFISHLPN